jgi:hypothetical protein
MRVWHGPQAPDKTKTMLKQIQTGPAMIARFAVLLVRRILAPALIACGLVLTIAWISLFGYGLIKLLELAT